MEKEGKEKKQMKDWLKRTCIMQKKTVIFDNAFILLLADGSTNTMSQSRHPTTQPCKNQSNQKRHQVWKSKARDHAQWASSN